MREKACSPATSRAAPPEPGRRERKKLATRAALREAALRLAVRHGVANVTVEQIAAEADLALRTFFNHFSSKEEAVVASVAAGAEALVAEFRRRPAGETVLAAVRESVLVVMAREDAAGRDHVQALRLIRDSPTLVPQQMAVLTAQERALADAVADRIGAESPEAAGLYPRLCAAAVLGALRVVLGLWLDDTTNPRDVPDDELLRQRIDEALASLAAGLDRPGARNPESAL